MELVRYKIIRALLRWNVVMGKKLVVLMAKYEADRYAEKTNKFDLRKIPDRIKKILIHDQSIIDRRMDECNACEHFIKATSQCKQCGCFMKIKTRLSTSRCPLNPPKWDKEYEFIKGKAVGTPITS